MNILKQEIKDFLMMILNINMKSKEVKQKEKTKTFDFDHITSTWKEEMAGNGTRDKLILFVLLILCVVPLSFPN